jgi:hypothetical protein
MKKDKASTLIVQHTSSYQHHRQYAEPLLLRTQMNKEGKGAARHRFRF